MGLLDRKIDLGLLILRLGLGVMMLLHGVAKISNGLGGIEAVLAAQNLPSWIAYGVYVGEIIAPLFMIVGYYTRLASLVFVVNMIVAVALVHPNDIFVLTNTGGWAIEMQGLYILGALTLVFTGAGKYAISSNKWWN